MLVAIAVATDATPRDTRAAADDRTVSGTAFAITADLAYNTDTDHGRVTVGFYVFNTTADDIRLRTVEVTPTPGAGDVIATAVAVDNAVVVSDPTSVPPALPYGGLAVDAHGEAVVVVRFAPSCRGAETPRSVLVLSYIDTRDVLHRQAIEPPTVDGVPWVAGLTREACV